MKSGYPIITLTTDFGLTDWFVGTMKGVILEIVPKARIVDITHAILPSDIRAGAFALRSAYGHFPKGTIHVAVVDPGVGTSRRAIGVRTKNHVFVGPDNGVLAWALACEKIIAVHSLDDTKFFLSNVSQTFHGRDVFAPVAAHLANGLPIRTLGQKLYDYERLPWPKPRLQRSKITGEVVYIDQFGNVITNLDTAALPRMEASAGIEVRLGRKSIGTLSPSYSSVPKGRPIAIIGSTGFLEIGINQGHAARALRISIGTPVTVRLPRGRPDR